MNDIIKDIYDQMQVPKEEDFKRKKCKIYLELHKNWWPMVPTIIFSGGKEYFYSFGACISFLCLTINLEINTVS